MRSLHLLLALTSKFHLLRGAYIKSPGDRISISNSILQRGGDDFGDPIVGDPIKGTLCDLPNLTTGAQEHVAKAPVTVPIRIPQVDEEQPLAFPKDNSAKSFKDFILHIRENGTPLGIRPDRVQVENWKIRYNGVLIPIGATGLWYPFGNQPQDFAMWGLKGCTAMFLVSPKGMWVGHLWEGSVKVNGASSFTKKYKDRDGEIAVGVRSIPEFNAIAVEILGQVTAPEDQPKRTGWISLADLKAYYGDPFSHGPDVDTFILTKAERISKRHYKHEYSLLTFLLVGVVAVQYTPYDHDGGGNDCTPMARMKIFYENNKDPVIDKSWPALPEQVNKNGFRDACLPSTSTSDTTISTLTTTPPSPITPAPIATPSCEYLPMDPDHGRDQPACVCGETATLPLITIQPSGTKSVFSDAASCAYTTMPGSSVTNPITTESQVWASDCVACTLVGGVADQETCTSVPSCTPTPTPTPSSVVPTFAVWIANRTVPIGDAGGKDGGKKLATDMFQKLRGLCDRGVCDFSQYAKMDGVETVVNGGEEPLHPEMYWESASFSNMTILEKMLAAGIATWIPAASQACKDVEYVAEADPTASGCGVGPVKREDGLRFMPTSRVLRRCNDNCGGDGNGSPGGKECHYKGHICKAPDLISVVMSDGKDPYANRIDIGIRLAADDSGTDQLICEVLVEGLTAAAMALAPELAPADAAEDMEFQTLCGDLGDLNFIGS
ncbi:hypothetical protein Hte_006416 [Hypoxylon texense]